MIMAKLLQTIFGIYNIIAVDFYPYFIPQALSYWFHLNKTLESGFSKF